LDAIHVFHDSCYGQLFCAPRHPVNTARAAVQLVARRYTLKWVLKSAFFGRQLSTAPNHGNHEGKQWFNLQ
jgi:hypothetical protein